MVFSDRLNGEANDETRRICSLWNTALDEASLAKLRFRVGDRVRLTEGAFVGGVGRIERLSPRSVYAYTIRMNESGDSIQAPDAQVESVDNEIKRNGPA